MFDNDDDYIFDSEEDDSGPIRISREFKITDDMSADIIIEKIKSDREERDRLKKVYQQRKKIFEEKYSNHIAKLDARETTFTEKLEEYYSSLPENKLKKTKTTTSYKLVSGGLKSKIQEPEYEINSDLLIPWLDENAPIYIEVEKKAKWGEFKKVTMVNADGDVVFALDNKKVDGVEAKVRPPKFVVE